MSSATMTRYMVTTDASQVEVEATSEDNAAVVFAEEEFPGRVVTGIDDLFTKREEADGAWVRIEVIEEGGNA